MLVCCAGKGGERGVARPEVLQELLGSCERVVQVRPYLSMNAGGIVVWAFSYSKGACFDSCSHMRL